MEFRKGDTVEMVDEALRMGLNGRLQPPVRGVVVGFGRVNSDRVRVQIQGRRTVDAWSASFWRIVEPADGGEG